MNGEYSINHPCGISPHIILYCPQTTQTFFYTKLNEKSNKSSETGRIHGNTWKEKLRTKKIIFRILPYCLLPAMWTMLKN